MRGRGDWTDGRVGQARGTSIGSHSGRLAPKSRSRRRLGVAGSVGDARDPGPGRGSGAEGDERAQDHAAPPRTAHEPSRNRAWNRPGRLGHPSIGIAIVLRSRLNPGRLSQAFLTQGKQV